jgi:hypothetical protein
MPAACWINRACTRDFSSTGCAKRIRTVAMRQFMG